METITQTARVLYTAKTRTIGGREKGLSKSSDGHLDITLSTPGTDRVGTNPEQLFAAGWSACFEGAIGIAAQKKGMAQPDSCIDAEIDLCYNKGDFFLRARLNISLPELDRVVALDLINDAEKICPYAKAIKGNVEYELNLV